MSVTRVSPDLAEFLHHPDEIRRIRKGTATVMLVLFATNVFAGPPGWNESTGTLTINMRISGTETYVRLGYGAGAPGGDYYLTIYKNSSGTEYSAWDGQSDCETSEIKKIVINGNNADETIDISIVDDSSVWDYASLSSNNILIYGGAGADDIKGSQLPDLIDGEGGLDDIWGNDGLDIVDGGADKDYLMDWESGESPTSCGRVFTVDKNLSTQNDHQRKSLQNLIDITDLNGGDLVQVWARTDYTETVQIVSNPPTDIGTSTEPLVIEGVNGKPVFDGQNSEFVFKLAFAEWIEVKNFVFKKGNKFNAHVVLSHDCKFIDCEFLEASGNTSHGDGVFVTGHDPNVAGVETWGITFDSCIADDNHRSGFEFNPQDFKKAGETTFTTGTMEDMSLLDCKARRNGLQGIRTQEIVGVTIDGGEFNNNDASGIQLETGTVDATIKDVTCDDNAQFYNNESGIWVAGCRDVTIDNCDMDGNPHGICIGQTEDIVIEDCTISNPLVNNGEDHLWVSGIRIGVGKSYYPESEEFDDPPPHNVANLPVAGVRDLDVINPTLTGFSGSPPTNAFAVYGIQYGGTTPIHVPGTTEHQVVSTNNHFWAAQPTKFKEDKWRLLGTTQGYDTDAEALNFHP